MFQKTGDTIKYNEIVKKIKELYSHKEYEDYDLCVTGHSLGAALASYLAYHLASSNDIMAIIPGPVTALTFASPRVGNGGYGAAFEVRQKYKGSVGTMILFHCQHYLVFVSIHLSV